MDLRQLKYFVAVFEHGNLSRAAEAIPISQPALTRSIKMLEDELGVELFERHARGASPTAAGERFYHHAKSILAECVRARDDALEPVGRLSGDISMGVAPLFVKYGIAEIVAEFCRKHELVSVTAVQGFAAARRLNPARGRMRMPGALLNGIDPSLGIFAEPVAGLLSSGLLTWHRFPDTLPARP